MDHGISKECIETLTDRIKNDISGEVIYLILDQCLDYNHSEKIIEVLLERKYLNKCLEIRIAKEEKYGKKKRDSGIFKRESIFSKKERKTDLKKRKK